MSPLTNPFVPYLNRYTTVTPGHEAAFDEFVMQAQERPRKELSLQTKTEAFVRNHFGQVYPVSIILTGNAGDGKTYLCRQIVETFTKNTLDDWGSEPERKISREDSKQTLRVVKDLSEVGREKGIAVLRDLATTMEESSKSTIFLIAANEGRLRDLLTRGELSNLYEIVDHQLRDGPDLQNQYLIVLNLNQVTTSSYVIPTLAWMSDTENWIFCEGCDAFNACPIRFNANRLRREHIAKRLELLYQILEHVGIHVTVRDMLIHLAYTVTGGKACEEIINKSHDLGVELHKDVYYNNVFGIELSRSFQRMAVINHLRRLEIGSHSQFDIDDFIVNGRPENEEAQKEYERLFNEEVDLGFKRFAQLRDAYLRGGTSSPQQGKDHPFIEEWLTHCRRKLFFEWTEDEQTIRLVPFTFLSRYLRLLDSDRGLQEQVKRTLVRGLNRAFSKLYVTDDDKLHVTAHYARTAEQPMPIIQLSLPIENIELDVRPVPDAAYDYNKRDLWLVISPPSKMMNRTPIRWPIDLLRFEYLMRLAEGGTYNVLADECELALRELKNELLTRFAAQVKEEGSVRFFVAENNRYILRNVRVDKVGNKIQVGED